MKRRDFVKAGAVIAGLNYPLGLQAQAAGNNVGATGDAPILVCVELSGGNDGLNSVVPFADDAYYRARPNIGIPAPELLMMDEHYGMNPGMLGMHKLWQRGQLAVVHGCGYERPTYSHFTAMGYWHSGVPHRGDAYGWLGRTADAMHAERRDNMLINIGSSQSAAVNSAVHTPVVFDDPERFARHRWMGSDVPGANQTEQQSTNPALNFVRAVDRSANSTATQIRSAWGDYETSVDYGIAPMDLPKVAACIQAGLPTQIYHVSFRNNAFDTHVQQSALHRRLLSYASDGIYGFISDLKRIGQAHRVVVLVHSEFGRRVPENANLGTDHGSANVMFMAGEPIKGGHYGEAPSLTELVDGDNLAFTTDFRRVYASAIEGWLGADAQSVLHGDFAPLPVFT